MNEQTIFQFIWKYIKNTRIYVGLILSIYLLYIMLSFIISIIFTYKVYYVNNETNKITTDRIYIRKVGTESKIQSFVRSYLSGSQKYTIKIPFNHDVRLKNISQSKKGDILVLNWNGYFYKELSKTNVDKEIGLLLLSIKKNFNIKEVIFVVMNKPINIQVGSYDLSQPIKLKNISKKKLKNF